MKTTGLLMVLLLTVVVGAQEGGFKKPQPKATAKRIEASKPVTQAEAGQTFLKVWNVLQKGARLKGANPVKIPSTTGPVTKNEVLIAFSAIVKVAEPQFKQVSRPAPVKTDRLRKDIDSSGFRLVERGYVGQYSVLVTGKNGPLTTKEFGDTVGILMVKLAERLHMPMRKFTPQSMPN